MDTVSPILLSIPPGVIHLRDDRKQLQWSVAIAPFQLGKYCVTQELYAAVTGTNPSAFKGNRHPVETVSWSEAIAFCNLLSEKHGMKPCYSIKDDPGQTQLDVNADGFRLPTEAEWEFACRGGTTGIRYAELDDIAWYKGNSGNTTHEVGLKAPNAWGLHDMLGNVWEWCTDLYDPQVYGTYRIIRGGGWCDEERGVMATNRRRSHPLHYRMDDLGFRLARNAV